MSAFGAGEVFFGKQKLWIASSKNYDKLDLALIIRLGAPLKTHGEHIEIYDRLDKASADQAISGSYLPTSVTGGDQRGTAFKQKRIQIFRQNDNGQKGKK